MLKEMTMLVIVLWGCQGAPTTAPRKQDLHGLSELYCKAKVVLEHYQLEDDKKLPHEVRSVMAFVFSQPGCNFTKLEEECQTMLAYHKLFIWFNKTYNQEGLLKPVVNSFPLLIDMQESYINYTCPEGTSREAPEITCPKYASNTPKLQNKFHFIFELYRNQIHDIWSSKLTEKQRNASHVCGTNP